MSAAFSLSSLSVWLAQAVLEKKPLTPETEQTDRAVASAILDMVWALNTTFERLTALGTGIADTREREAFMRSLGSVMDKTHDRLLVPILRRHPELDTDPDKPDATSRRCRRT